MVESNNNSDNGQFYTVHHTRTPPPPQRRQSLRVGQRLSRQQTSTRPPQQTTTTTTRRRGPGRPPLKTVKKIQGKNVTGTVRRNSLKKILAGRNVLAEAIPKAKYKKVVAEIPKKRMNFNSKGKEKRSKAKTLAWKSTFAAEKLRKKRNMNAFVKRVKARQLEDAKKEVEKAEKMRDEAKKKREEADKVMENMRDEAKKKVEKAKKNAEEALKKGLKNASERGDKTKFDQLWNSIPLPQREGYKNFVEPLLRKMPKKPLVVKMKKKVVSNRNTNNNFEMMTTITQMRKLNNEKERRRAFLEKRADLYKESLKRALSRKNFTLYTRIIGTIPDSVKDKVMSFIKPFWYKAKKEQEALQRLSVEELKNKVKKQHEARQRLMAEEANRSIKQNNIDLLASFAKTMQEGELLTEVRKKAKNEKNMMKFLKKQKINSETEAQKKIMKEAQLEINTLAKQIKNLDAERKLKVERDRKRHLRETELERKRLENERKRAANERQRRANERGRKKTIGNIMNAVKKREQKKKKEKGMTANERQRLANERKKKRLANEREKKRLANKAAMNKARHQRMNERESRRMNEREALKRKRENNNKPVRTQRLKSTPRRVTNPTVKYTPQQTKRVSERQRRANERQRRANERQRRANEIQRLENESEKNKKLPPKKRRIHRR